MGRGTRARERCGYRGARRLTPFPLPSSPSSSSQITDELEVFSSATSVLFNPATIEWQPPVCDSPRMPRKKHKRHRPQQRGMDASTCHRTEAPRHAWRHAELIWPCRHSVPLAPALTGMCDSTRSTPGHTRRCNNTHVPQTCNAGTTGNTPSSCPQQAQHHPRRGWQRPHDTCRPASSDPEARLPRRRRAADSATHRHVSRHTCHSHMALSHGTLTWHSHMSLSRVTLACHSLLVASASIDSLLVSSAFSSCPPP